MLTRFLLCLACLQGCATLPQHPVERALYHDLDTLVATRERIAWVTDRHEVESLASGALRSGCAVAEPRRTGLRAWLDRRIAAEGGSAEAVWRAAGEDLAAAQRILTLERVRMVLDYVNAHAEADCPFWIARDAGFDGVHASARRFVLMAESMGSAQMLLSGGEVDLGGHGLLRILPGYGFSDRLTIAAGIEGGVSSTFPKDGGTRTLAAAWVGGVPVLLRVVTGTWRYDTDLAVTFRAPEQDLDAARWGGRISQAIGVSAPRIAGLQPYVMAWAGYEYLPGDDDLNVVRVGTRVGVDWDP